MKPQLVMLCGTARAGKDALASAIADQMWLRKHPSATVRLGDLVREELAAATGVSVDDQLIERDGWRKVWQWWGTEVRRQLCDEDYWVKHWCVKAALLPGGTSLLVPDVRFGNELYELDLFAKRTGRTPRVLVVRRSRVWELMQFRRRSRLHKSERDWRQWVWNYDPIVVSNTRSLDALQDAAGDLVQEWSEA